VKARLATERNREMCFDSVCFKNQLSRKIGLLDKGEHVTGVQ